VMRPAAEQHPDDRRQLVKTRGLWADFKGRPVFAPAVLSQLDSVMAEFDDRGNKRRRHDQPRHDQPRHDQGMRAADPRAQYRPGSGPPDATVALQEVSALLCSPPLAHRARRSSATSTRPGLGLLRLFVGAMSRSAHWPQYSTPFIHPRSFAVAVMGWCFDGHIQYHSERLVTADYFVVDVLGDLLARRG